MSFIKLTIRGYALFFKVTMFALLASLMGFLMFSSIQEAQAVGLKDNGLISDDKIKLGDIFYDLERDQDRVLGAAPKPGQDMVLNARTLLRIAVAMDLPWRPSSSSDFIVLSREGTVIGREFMQTAIQEALKEKNIEGKYELSLNHNGQDITLPAHMDAEIEVTKLKLNKKRNRFEATLVAPSKDNPIKRVQVSGLITPLTDVPALKDNMRNGDIIRKNDIEMIEIRSRDLNHDTVMRAEELIGMTPRRLVLAGQPIKDDAIQSPRMVERGEFVTMTYRSGPLVLTAQAKALEHGSKGDIIRVVNTNSSKTLEAEVIASKEVIVSTF